MVYTLLEIFGIDASLLGIYCHMSIRILIIFIFLSFVLKFCYVHRLPLYYVAVNELITSIDYYSEIPTSELDSLIIQSLLIIFTIFGYSFYYIKTHKHARF
jgi:hypothetical protein